MTTPGYAVPVMVREAGEEESLAENVVRMPLHPADQFEAFRRLELSGLGAAEIAARFGVSLRIVRQRLALGAASPHLMQAYREGEWTRPAEGPGARSISVSPQVAALLTKEALITLPSAKLLAFVNSAGLQKHPLLLDKTVAHRDPRIKSLITPVAPVGQAM